MSRFDVRGNGAPSHLRSTRLIGGGCDATAPRSPSITQPRRAQHPAATLRCETLAHNSDVQPPRCHAAPPHGRPAAAPPGTHATPPRCEAFRCKRWLHNVKLQDKAFHHNHDASSPPATTPPSRSEEGCNEAGQRWFVAAPSCRHNAAWQRRRFATERRGHGESRRAVHHPVHRCPAFMH